MNPPDQRTFHLCQIEPDDIIIVVATPAMQDAAIKLGSGQPVFLDATHGLCKYGSKLTTLLAMDEECRGVPIAWAIVSHEEIVVYAKVLQTLKDVYELRAKRANWVWAPSCVLCDNSDKEIGGIRCAFPLLAGCSACIHSHAPLASTLNASWV